ncbi:uncharacterized protein LOC123037545 [Drosophila rhopaloa]|uniref:DUF5641 domain-containing protein n=1 Tax=Drosophila rhopaloa TaxID=1041015 RepID=A0ABM5J7B6_DRORH|nr:uncharacterized protein LOC123037545 [Drosophila rhopaloa]
MIETEINGDTTSIINRWQHLKALHQQFCLRWKEEYLKELHKRNTRILRAGDMVVVKEDNLPSINVKSRVCLITKRYVLVLVCFVTKAIHLEPTSDLTTEKFIATFARFEDAPEKEGLLSSIFSKLSKKLRRVPIVISSCSGSSFLREPPTWEACGRKALIASRPCFVYRHAKIHVRRADYLASIEASLNSHPLAPMSEEPADLLAFTPGHFLVGWPLLAMIETEINGDTTSIINRWQHLKALHQQFCLRWKEEYLKELHKRNTRILRAGDMVVVKEDNLPSIKWQN